MAVVCLKSKFGYCKFGSRCENIHYKEVCEKDVKFCIGKLCEKRHPVFCKFFQQFGRCKFGEFCSYRHTYNKENKTERKVDEMKFEIKELKSEVVELKTEVTELKTEVVELKTDVVELKTETNMLKTKLERLEIMLKNSEKCENKQGKNDKSEIEEKTLEDIIRENSEENKVHKCDECNIEKSSKTKLLIHKDKRHTEYQRYGSYRRLKMVCNGGDGFDYECTFCLAHFNGDIKIHLREKHAYLGEETLNRGYFEETY